MNDFHARMTSVQAPASKARYFTIAPHIRGLLECGDYSGNDRRKNLAGLMTLRNATPGDLGSSPSPLPRTSSGKDSDTTEMSRQTRRPLASEQLRCQGE